MSGLHDLAKEAGLNPFVPEGADGKKFNTSKVLEDFFALIIKKCAAGETVRIKDFGTFRARLYKGRTLKSPLLAGGEVSFGDTMVLRFHQSTVAKKSLNEAAGSEKKQAKADKGAKAEKQAKADGKAEKAPKADKKAAKKAKKAAEAAAAEEASAE